MNSDLLESTKRFLCEVEAVREPQFYLPQSTSWAERTGRGADGYGNIPAWRMEKLREVLLRASSSIPEPFGRMCEQLGLSRAQGLRIVKDGVDIGWLIERRYHPSRRGGGFKLVFPTEQGWIQLERMGRPRPGKVLGGDVEHDSCGRLLAALAGREGYSWRFEVCLGEDQTVRCDVALKDKKGGSIYCQCCFSCAGREADACCRILSVVPLECSRVLLVCRDKAFATRLQKLLKPQHLFVQNKDKVSIKLFADLLEAYYKRPGEVVLGDFDNGT